MSFSIEESPPSNKAVVCNRWRSPEATFLFCQTRHHCWDENASKSFDIGKVWLGGRTPALPWWQASADAFVIHSPAFNRLVFRLNTCACPARKMMQIWWTWFHIKMIQVYSVFIFISYSWFTWFCFWWLLIAEAVLQWVPSGPLRK